MSFSEFVWPGFECQEKDKELGKRGRGMRVALSSGRHGTSKDEVVERQTPWLRADTAESEGLGIGWGSAVAQMQAVWRQSRR